MNKTDKLNAIKEAFRFATDEAFDLWINEGCPYWEDGVDSTNLKWTPDGYVVYTDEMKAADREKQRQYNIVMQARWDAGERDMGLTMWKMNRDVMQLYVARIEDTLFNAKPLLYQTLTKGDDEEN